MTEKLRSKMRIEQTSCGSSTGFTGVQVSGFSKLAAMYVLQTLYTDMCIYGVVSVR